MDLKRLDEIFQTVRGVPVIGGFYIGMDEEKASELSNELKEYKTEHSCEYPADLIYQYKISFDYRCFNNAYSVSAIDVTFPKGDWLKQIVELKDYFSKRFYHKEKIGGSIKDENGDFENFCFSQCDYLFRLLIFSNGKKLTVSLKARLDSADVYCALNNISQDLELEKFIRKSMFLCKETDKVNKDFNKVIPFKYGLPLFLNMGFGDPLEIADECGSLEDLPIEISSGNTVSEDFGIHYELLTDEDNRVRTIILNLRKESEGLWPLLRYIRENFLIKESGIELGTEIDYNPDRIKGYFENEYIKISIGTPYYSSYDDISIEINAIDEDHLEKYSSMYTTFRLPYALDYIDGIREFFKYRNPTQDAKFNELRQHYETFEEAANVYTREHASWARDMGGYSKGEEELDRGACLRHWNTPNSKGFPASWIQVAIPK